ncbi:MAG: hypothetical protein WD077_02775 [Bacteroidia bacterium]
MVRKKSKRKPPTKTASKVAPLSIKATVPRGMRIAKYAALVMVLLFGTVLSMKSLQEPDLWWQLLTGQYILQEGAIPRVDIFSYTFAGTDWLNVKWGYEVLMALAAKAGGPELILFLQIVITLLLLLSLYRVFRIFHSGLFGNNRQGPTAGFVIVAILSLAAFEFRMTGRPEAVSHLMVGVFLWLLMRWRQQPGLWIYLLVPLQMFWANLHEAYGTGLVMTLGFPAACWAEYLWGNRFGLKTPKPLHLTIAAALSIPAVAIHPFGWELIIHPLNIFFQLQENKFTAELESVFSPNYWEFQAYINILFFVISIAGYFLLKNKIGKDLLNIPFQRFGLGYLLFLFLFFYLSLSAYRNIPFFIIISFPAVAVAVDGLAERLLSSKRSLAANFLVLRQVAFIFLFLMLAVGYVMVVTGNYYKWTGSNDRYGLQTDAVNAPLGAVEFIKEHGLAGERSFTDYIISSYPLWALHPEYKTYIDLRDLDIFPAGFFQRFLRIATQPEGNFEQADSTWQFGYVLLYRNQFMPLHGYLISSEQYEMVYADPVAVLYVNKSHHPDLAEKFGFDGGSNDIFSNPQNPEVSVPALVISRLFWPAFQEQYYPNLNTDLEASGFYFRTGYRELAWNRAVAASNSNIRQWEAYLQLGNLTFQVAQQQSDETEMKRMLQEASSYFKQSINIKENAGAFLGLGLVNILYNNVREAEKQLQNCIDTDRSNSECYTYMAEVEFMYSQQNPTESGYHLREQRKYIEKAMDLNPDSPFLLLQMGISHYRFNECEEAMEYLDRVRNFPGFSAQEQRMLQDCLRACGGVL